MSRFRPLKFKRVLAKKAHSNEDSSSNESQDDYDESSDEDMERKKKLFLKKRFLTNYAKKESIPNLIINKLKS